MVKKRILFISLFLVLCIACIIIFFFTRKTSEKNFLKSWNVEDYEQLEDIINIEDAGLDNGSSVETYSIRYKSDDCEVISYLSVPKKCLEDKEAFPCIIFNHGGN